MSLFDGGAQVLMLSLLSLLSPPSYCQHCRLINATELDAIIYQVHPVSDGALPPFRVMEYNITCLAVSSMRDRYRYTSVSVIYTNRDEVIFAAIVDVGCNSKNQWDFTVLGDVDLTWTPLSEGTVAEAQRRDCALCLSNMNPMAGGRSDNLTHCVGKKMRHLYMYMYITVVISVWGKCFTKNIIV